MSNWAHDCELIRQTISLYCQLLDDNRFEELSALFTLDAELPWEGRVLRGRADIAANMQTTQMEKGMTRHLPFGPVIDIRQTDETAPREARAWSDVMVTVYPPDATAFIGWTGRYHQHFKYTDGLWRIHRHVAIGNREALPANVEPVTGQAPQPG